MRVCLDAQGSEVGGANQWVGGAKRVEMPLHCTHNYVALFPGLQSPNAVEGLVKLLRR